MSDVVLVAIIAAVPPTIMALAGLLVSWGNRRSLAVVHKTTNSLAQRNEEIAAELGEIKGRAAEKANPST